MILKNKRKRAYFVVVACLILATVLICLPADYFDHGKSVCLSVTFFDMECYGCGMTRAIHHLIHLDFHAAWGFNRLSFIVLPLFVFMTGFEVRKMWLSADTRDQIDEK